MTTPQPDSSSALPKPVQHPAQALTEHSTRVGSSTDELVEAVETVASGEDGLDGVGGSTVGSEAVAHAGEQAVNHDQPDQASSTLQHYTPSIQPLLESESAQPPSARETSPSRTPAPPGPVDQPSPSQQTTQPVAPPHAKPADQRANQSRSAEDQLQQDEWLLKTIHWPPLPAPPSSATGAIQAGPPIKIIMQHANGPCSLVALCNTLILRGDIHITAPPSRQSVTYHELSSLVANFLLASERAQSGSMSAALSILPSTRYGLEVNPRFASIDGFRESPTATGELALFSLSGVPLVHGWVADPQNEDEWEVVVGQCGDYDAATLLLVQAAELTGGVSAEQLELDGDDEALIAHAERMSTLSPAQSEIVRKAAIIHAFLNTSSTQLTYHGLLLLSTQLGPGSLAALFRNSHLSTIYRRPAAPDSRSPAGPQLFTLVTDSAFVHEPEIVWESLEDVDGAGADFFDAALRPARLPRGDFVRRRADPQADEADDGSAALARQLQREEEEAASRRRLEREQWEQRQAWEEADAREAEARSWAEARQPTPQGSAAAGRQSVPAGTGKKAGKKDKDKSCCIM